MQVEDSKRVGNDLRNSSKFAPKDRINWCDIGLQKWSKKTHAVILFTRNLGRTIQRAWCFFSWLAFSKGVNYSVLTGNIVIVLRSDSNSKPESSLLRPWPDWCAWRNQHDVATCQSKHAEWFTPLLNVSHPTKIKHHISRCSNSSVNATTKAIMIIRLCCCNLMIGQRKILLSNILSRYTLEHKLPFAYGTLL